MKDIPKKERPTSNFRDSGSSMKYNIVIKEIKF